MVDPQIKSKVRQRLSTTLQVAEERTSKAVERLEFQTIKLSDIVQKRNGNGNGKLRK